MKAGLVFRDFDRGPEMVEIPPGAFEMGAPASEVGSDRVERPQHQVTILHAFAAGIFPITFDEWDAYVDDGESGAHRAGDEGWGRGRQPVINVSLNVPHPMWRGSPAKLARNTAC